MIYFEEQLLGCLCVQGGVGGGQGGGYLREKRGKQGRDAVVTKVEGSQEQGKEVERKQTGEAEFTCKVPPPPSPTPSFLSSC